MPRAWLSWSLRGGALYFLLVALVHSFGWHVPGLYVFFDVPSTPFQDQIIGLLAFGWSVWLLETARRCLLDPAASIRGVLAAGVVAVCALARIAAFTELPGSGLARTWHGVFIGLLMIYVAVLVVLDRATRGSGGG